MPEFHSEPYLHLAGLSHKSALIAWGAFYFRTRSDGEWKLVDDKDLRHVHPPRRESIGRRSESYGPARVTVFDRAGNRVASSFTETTNWCWITGLEPDTLYSYEVVVDEEVWGEGERWDWQVGARQGLVKAGGRYRNEFRTHPDPARALDSPLTFAVIGDFGVGVRKSGSDRRQREVAEALERAAATLDVRLILTTGDNIYAGKRLLGLPVGDEGDEDDDWFFTFFQPYRYLLNRVPVYPSIGNHDSDESEDRDDREQLMDNLYLRERLASDEAAGRASLDPGLFYRFRYGRDVEFVCIDTSKEDVFKAGRLFEYPKHQAFLDQAFPTGGDGVRWRIPFGHHPTYSAGPRHHNTKAMQKLVPLFRRSGVRAVFSGHEHNFQHSRADGIDYFLSGAAGKLRKEAPNQLEEAHTVSWSVTPHFLAVTVDAARMTVRAFGELRNGALEDIPRTDARGQTVADPMVVELARAATA